MLQVPQEALQEMPFAKEVALEGRDFQLQDRTGSGVFCFFV
jgi:hypothetical protein